MLTLNVLHVCMGKLDRSGTGRKEGRGRGTEKERESRKGGRNREHAREMEIRKEQGRDREREIDWKAGGYPGNPTGSVVPRAAAVATNDPSLPPMSFLGQFHGLMSCIT
ncbi:hypothetical protein ANTQUA_LOCUS8069 [Anthophora quadrimaculata]